MICPVCFKRMRAEYWDRNRKQAVCEECIYRDATVPEFGAKRPVNESTLPRKTGSAQGSKNAKSRKWRHEI